MISCAGPGARGPSLSTMNVTSWPAGRAACASVSMIDRTPPSVP